MSIDWIATVLNSPAITLLDNSLSMAEVFGFATGLMCVWLTAKRNIWNFPLGILNCLLLMFLFFEARLFADTALQFVFITLGVIGWWQWHGGRRRDEYPIEALSGRGVAIGVAVVVAGTGVLFALLTAVKGSVPILDAFITSASLVAQWLLNARKLQTWYFWIAVDVVSVPLYAHKGLWLIAILYAVFLVLCVIGLRRWQAATEDDRLAPTGAVA